jgi:hypothetical protein
MQPQYSPLLACGESSAAGGFPAVGDWRTRRGRGQYRTALNANRYRFNQEAVYSNRY